MQVRILHEEMRFPMWLNGRTTITFQVASTFPKKAAVQLVAGTEVAVAPKRLKTVNPHGDPSMLSSKGKKSYFKGTTARSRSRQETSSQKLCQRH
ncbi:hypothetical protein C1H46_043680 [Malus baccata]|uniref:Peroxisomal ATPase PEX1 N-terminal C-lobe domain-containing protein n=1 Tax=Malus baccata TaxID=106549 RepID=A0A540K976_MALBA|nr:hypothetical protein C1H46_043680 [Malus baccata]